MHVLVTGATGFLGRTLCPLLKKQGHQVVELSSKNCDLQKDDALDGYTEQFDRIYHLAIWTQSGDFPLRHPAEQWMINQKIHTHLLDWWQKKQPQAKLIAMGTSCAYDPNLPLEEEYFLAGHPIESLAAYAMTKRMLLCGMQAMQKQYGLNYLFLIPATLYGLQGFEEGKQLHFIFDLVRKIARAKLFGEKVVLWGDGEQRRELLCAEDFARALLQLSDTSSNTEINVGEGEDHSIKEFALILCEKAGYPFENIEFDTSRYVGTRSKLLSIKKFRRALPGFKSRPLHEGLGEMMEGYLQQLSKNRGVS